MLTAVLAGLAAGGTYALLGVCAVFTYRLVAVVNFTGAAVGATGAYAMVMLHEQGVPLALAVVFGVAVGAATAALIGLVMARWFADASAQTKAAVTVASLVGLIALGLRVTGGQHPRAFPEIFPGAAVTVAGVVVTDAAVATIVLAILFTISATSFLGYTRVGLQLRALSENAMAAELTGIRTRLLATLTWMVTGAATSFAFMIIAPERAPNFMSLSELVVPAFAAALLGFFRSFWLTVVGGIALGLAEGAASDLTSLAEYRSALPFVIILAILLWAQRGARWDEAR